MTTAKRFLANPMMRVRIVPEEMAREIGTVEEVGGGAVTNEAATDVSRTRNQGNSTSAGIIGNI